MLSEKLKEFLNKNENTEDTDMEEVFEDIDLKIKPINKESLQKKKMISIYSIK
jgi:hypothetical protein